MEQEILIALVVGITQLVKTQGVLDSKYAPFLAIVLGVVLSLLGGLTVDNLIAGMVAGLISQGVYSTVKSGVVAGKELVK